MQKRTFLLLVAATVVLVALAGYALVGAPRGGGGAAAAGDRRAFPELEKELGDLAWMRVTHGAMRADFNAIAGHWGVVEKGNYPAAPGKVRSLLLGLAELTLVEPKTERPDLYSRLGLDDPEKGQASLVQLQDRLGKTVAELVVGKTRHDRLGIGDDGVYVRKPGEARTWLARGSLVLPGTVVEWLDRPILDIPSSRINSLTLTAADGTVLSLKRGSDAKFAVIDPPEDAKFKPPEALAMPAGALAGLALDDVRPAADMPVPDSGVATASLTTYDGLTLTFRLFERGNADWAAIAAAGSGAAEAEAAALNTRLARWVFALPPARAKLLRTRLADLVEPAKGS